MSAGRLLGFRGNAPKAADPIASRPAYPTIIAAELFPGTRAGLGYRIATAHEQASYHYGFASILVIGTIGLGLDGLLRLAASSVTHWQPKQR